MPAVKAAALLLNNGLLESPSNFAIDASEISLFPQSSPKLPVSICVASDTLPNSSEVKIFIADGTSSLSGAFTLDEGGKTFF